MINIFINVPFIISILKIEMTDIYFPFNTCEEPNKKDWIAQPVSAFINFISF